VEEISKKLGTRQREGFSCTAGRNPGKTAFCGAFEGKWLRRSPYLCWFPARVSIWPGARAKKSGQQGCPRKRKMYTAVSGFPTASPQLFASWTVLLSKELKLFSPCLSMDTV